MDRNTLIYFVLLIIVGSVIGCVSEQKDVPNKDINKDIKGTWSGTLDVKDTNIRLAFNISETDGRLTAVMYSPDQIGKSTPVNKVTFDNNNIRLEMKVLIYEGKIKEDGMTIEGQLKEPNAIHPLILKKEK